MENFNGNISLRKTAKIEKPTFNNNNIRIKVIVDSDQSSSDVKRFVERPIGPYAERKVSINDSKSSFLHHLPEITSSTVLNCSITISNSIPGKMSNDKIQNILSQSAKEEDFQTKQFQSNAANFNLSKEVSRELQSTPRKEISFNSLQTKRRSRKIKDNFSKHSGISKKPKNNEKKKQLVKALKSNLELQNELNRQIATLQYNNKIDQHQLVATVHKKEKRMIIIDGSNVAYGHGQTIFSVKGIELCLEYFEQQGFQVKAVCSQMRMKPSKSSDQKRLETLVREKRILLTPCKNLPGNRSTSYEDRIIFGIAASFDAAIISNDNFLDLLNENSEWKEIIEKRVVGYVWCMDKFFLPPDPYGKSGPSLEDILYKQILPPVTATPLELVTKRNEKNKISYP